MRLTQTQVQNILFYFKEGYNALEIAERYKCTPLTIQNYKKKLKDAGHKFPTTRHRRPSIDISKIIKV